MEKVETVVIGAGVVGLAVARELARTGREVIVVEGQDTINSGVSSRNSEVIHAGIYYPRGSLKARFCVEGKRKLYAFCDAFGVPHKRIGKLIVATNKDEVPVLDSILDKAEANGVGDLRWVDESELRELEPALEARRALLSPSTGIIDSHAFGLALQGDAEDHGAVVAFKSSILAGQTGLNGTVLTIGGADGVELHCREVVNAGGLGACDFARSVAGFPQAMVPHAYFAKGSYFALSGPSPFRHLVYPVPVPGGLGTHLTLDMMGRAKFGPDVEWVDTPSYDVEPSRAQQFYKAIRRYWPDLADGALIPDYAGVRPKIHGPDAAAADFVVQGPKDHGVAGLVNLFGIESPGLTSALAIAERTRRLLDEGAGQIQSLGQGAPPVCSAA